jgi:hypothetical protein
VGPHRHNKICGGKSATGRGFSPNASVLPSASFHQYSVLTFIDMLLLPQGKTRDTWKPLENNPLSDTGEHWMEKTFLEIQQ